MVVIGHGKVSEALLLFPVTVHDYILLFIPTTSGNVRGRTLARSGEIFHKFVNLLYTYVLYSINNDIQLQQ